MKPALSLPDPAQFTLQQMQQRMNQFGFGFASAQANIQLRNRMEQLRRDAPVWEVPRTPVQNPDLVVHEEIKGQEPIAESVQGRSIGPPIEENTSDQSITELDVQEILSEDESEETTAMLQELQQNPNPAVQNEILVDLEMRRQIGNEIAVQVGQEQGADNEEQRNSILDFIMRLPHDRLKQIFKAGASAVGFITQVYTLWLISRKNSLVNKDLKGMGKVYDVSYDTYIPVENVLDKPVPQHCRRILFKDEFGRTRSKLICGNVQDRFGVRVYYNN